MLYSHVAIIIRFVRTYWMNSREHLITSKFCANVKRIIVIRVLIILMYWNCWLKFVLALFCPTELELNCKRIICNDCVSNLPTDWRRCDSRQIYDCDIHLRYWKKTKQRKKKQNFQDVKNKHRVHYLFGHRFVVCKHIPVERQNKLKWNGQKCCVQHSTTSFLMTKLSNWWTLFSHTLLRIDSITNRWVCQVDQFSYKSIIFSIK